MTATPNAAPRELTYADALYEATIQEMERDPTVFVYGLGVDDVKGMYGTTKDLHVKFGPDRNFDTPLSEDALTGVGIGAAMAGCRPIHVHQRMDFLLLCMNQLVNLAAKQRYISAGNSSVPLVVRAIIGRSWGQGAQHSQSLHSYFMHIPGLKVVAPTTPHDAKGCLIAAIRDENPVIFMEHRMLYNLKGAVPEQAYAEPFGKARILREGTDVTIVAITHMVVEAARAANVLAQMGISAELIDPVSLLPLDVDAIAESVAKTGRLLVVDHDWTIAGASAEIVAAVCEKLQTRRAALYARMGYAFSPCPTTKPLENVYYPDGASIAARAYEMVKGDKPTSLPSAPRAAEIEAFKGPF